MVVLERKVKYWNKEEERMKIRRRKIMEEEGLVL